MMRHGHTRRRTVWASLALVIVASGALAARGGGNQEPPTNGSLEFRDATDDAIRSDGLGPYRCNAVDSVNGPSVTLETGRKRALVFDFSTGYGDVSAYSPPSGTVSDVSMYVSPNGGGYFEFTAAGGRWVINAYGVFLTEYDDDGDGVTDRYEIDSDGTYPSYLDKVLSQGLRSPHYEPHGTYLMRWHATVLADG